MLERIDQKAVELKVGRKYRIGKTSYRPGDAEYVVVTNIDGEEYEVDFYTKSWNYVEHNHGEVGLFFHRNLSYYCGINFK